MSEFRLYNHDKGGDDMILYGLFLVLLLIFILIKIRYRFSYHQSFDQRINDAFYEDIMVICCKNDYVILSEGGIFLICCDKLKHPMALEQKRNQLTSYLSQCGIHTTIICYIYDHVEDRLIDQQSISYSFQEWIALILEHQETALFTIKELYQIKRMICSLY